MIHLVKWKCAFRSRIESICSHKVHTCFMSEFNILFRNMRLVRKIILQEIISVIDFDLLFTKETRIQKKITFRLFLHYGYFSLLISADCFWLDYIKYLIVFCVILVLFFCVYFFQVVIFHIFLLSIYKLCIASLYRNQIYSISKCYFS